MGKQILIGREGNQPFAIGDPKVSSRHATLSINDNGQIILIDNNSTNGTFIYNGQMFERIYPNQPYNVTPESMIQLGPDTRFHVRRLLNPVVNGASSQQHVSKSAQPPRTAQPKPERVNIKNLQLISENYTERKMQLESKSGTINNLRSCTILISLATGSIGVILKQALDMDESKGLLISVLSLVIAAVMMTVLLIFISNYSKKIMREKAANEKDYSIKYVCPKCSLSFKGKIYENILSEGKCPRCKTEYYASDSKK